ncbi:MAG: phosphatase PAP2 family protein [Acidimicrobiales bacterium]
MISTDVAGERPEEPARSADDTARGMQGPWSVSLERDVVATHEMEAGGVLIAAVVAAGIFFALRPAPSAVDVWVQSWIAGSKSNWFTTVTKSRFPVVIVAGSVVAAAGTWLRDRIRAGALLVAPSIALVLCEWVVKPLVGRTIGGTPSFPSGSVVGVTAVATAAVLAVPRSWRVPVVLIAGCWALWMVVAVIALRWHFPTDAVAGLALSVGVVLSVDGAAAKAARRIGAVMAAR